MKREAVNVGERFWQGVYFALPWGVLAWILFLVVLAWLKLL